MRIRNLGKIVRLAIELEEVLKESGLKESGDSIENYFRSSIVDKEQIKGRISELIMVQKVLPITTLAEILNIAVGEAENLIYELAAEGIDGDLEEGVFKFTSSPEIVLSKLFELVNEM